jgi:hypothetical protein
MLLVLWPLVVVDPAFAPRFQWALWHGLVDFRQNFNAQGVGWLLEFALLLPGARENMGRYSLMVAAMAFKEGPGFIVLAGTGVPGSAMFLDPDCAIARLQAGDRPLGTSQ